MSTTYLQLGVEFVTIDDLNPGDHIAVAVNTRYLTIKHHGIVVDGEKVLKVISFTSNMKKARGSDTGTIHEENLRDFSEGGQLIRITYPPNEAFSPQWVVYRARRLLQYPAEYKSYHARSNNCEHFATFCKAGEKQSNQASLAGIAQTIWNSLY